MGERHNVSNQLCFFKAKENTLKKTKHRNDLTLNERHESSASSTRINLVLHISGWVVSWNPKWPKYLPVSVTSRDFWWCVSYISETHGAQKPIIFAPLVFACSCLKPSRVNKNNTRRDYEKLKQNQSCYGASAGLVQFNGLFVLSSWQIKLILNTFLLDLKCVNIFTTNFSFPWVFWK